MKILLFGSPELWDGDAPVPVKRRKTVALMAYLAVSGQRRTRDSLAAMFWPEMPERKALSYLRNALWELNQTPLSRFLEADRRSVQLQVTGPDARVVDVAVFRNSLARVAAHNHSGGRLCDTCLAHLKAAASLVRDPFLVGFSVPDSPEFDQWMRLEEEVLHREYTQCLHALTDHYYYAADWPLAVRAATLWIASDPLNEMACRHGMVAAAAAGQTAGALQIYEQCRRLLQDELDIEPDDDTETLYYQIRTGRFTDAPHLPSPDPVVPPIPVPRTRLVGRRRELDELREMFRDPACRLVTLIGPGGSGKTRLAMAVARDTAADFANGVVWVSLEPLRTGDP
ncbi:MAG TPA: BTAD domain-containing putative transcriptional regulator, partial [bacterium]|nr:BTAD domain-containing putative transcriptional regulator [bacterium]